MFAIHLLVCTQIRRPVREVVVIAADVIVFLVISHMLRTFSAAAMWGGDKK